MDPVALHADPGGETALLIGVQFQGHTPAEVHDSLDELEQLAGTAGARVLDRLVCKHTKPTPGHYIGSGKAAEIAEWINENKPTLVVFDDDLSPAQGRNIEALFKTRVIDRTQLILDIFAQHARTKEGCLQIELAQLTYLLPRLRRMWTHLERQKGGIGLRGPGETQLESDRRRIEERLARLRKELDQVRRHRHELRRGRRRHGWALVTLVGYTNAGKSTLLNALTGADVKAYDQLFATLDPTTRQVRLPNHQSVLLTDTVGFIRKLPHGLVESFKATLEEVGESDVLVHVIDASHPQVEAQMYAVRDVLNDIGAGEKAVVHALNKIDTPEGATQARILKKALPHSVMVSARSGEGMSALLDELCDVLRDRHARISALIPVREGKLIATLRSSANVLTETYEEDMVRIEAYVPAPMMGALGPFLENKNDHEWGGTNGSN